MGYDIPDHPVSACPSYYHYLAKQQRPLIVYSSALEPKYTLHIHFYLAQFDNKSASTDQLIHWIPPTTTYYLKWEP